MSFVGQFRSASYTGRPLGDPAFLTYSVGAIVGGAGFGFAASFLSSVAVGHLSEAGRFVGVGMTAAVLVLLDAGRLRSGRETSACLIRQTPQHWRERGAIGVFGWGLDTGTPVSTIRVSELPAIGTIILLWGLGPWWSVLAYSAGVVGGLLLSLYKVGRAEAAGDTSLPEWMHEARLGARRWSGGRLLVPGTVVAVISVSLAVA